MLHLNCGYIWKFLSNRCTHIWHWCWHLQQYYIWGHFEPKIWIFSLFPAVPTSFFDRAAVKMFLEKKKTCRCFPPEGQKFISKLQKPYERTLKK